MSTPVGSSQWMYSSGAGSFYPYSIDQSLRFNDGDSAKLYFDPTTDGNKQVWTFSAWVKRGNLGLNYATFFSGTNSSGYQTDIRFDSADQLRVVTSGAALTMDFKTNRVFRDVGSWYHIVVAVDTTDATLLNRVKIYVNGVQETSLATTTCTQNSNCILNTASNQTTNVGALGYTTTVTKEFDGYMAEVHFVDGTQYAASDFGETINGIWVPKNVSGLTYGTNGFYLTFEGTGTATTTQGTTAQTNIGDDQAGAGNNFTVINLAASDVVLDSPTGNNFATWNPLDKYNYNSPSEGNLRALTAGNNGTQNSTFAVSSGKWYFEVRNGTAGSATVNRFVGIAKEDTNISSTPFLNTDCYLYYSANGNKYNGSGVSYGDSWQANGDIIGIAFDADNGAIWFSKNGTWQNSATASEIAAGTTTNAAFTGLSGTFVMMVSKTGGTSSNDPHHANFGQDSTFADATTAGGNADDNGYGDFKYAPPSGFLALCSANLPEPAIGPNSTTQADNYFNIVLYTGTGAAQSITGANHAPDLLWIKRRNANNSHILYDSVRGDWELSTNSTAGEISSAGRIDSLDADGFTLENTTAATLNASGGTFVSWLWKAGGSSNTFNIDGTGYATASDAGLSGGNIAADAASINTTSGISILKYTGDGSSSPYSTIKHGLYSPPEVYICKSLDSTNADNWVFFHTLVDGSHDFMYLNLQNSNSNSAINFTPTLTTVKVGGDATNENNKNFLMIAMHSVENFSKFGTYVGNGDPDGTFVYTGFRPAWVMMKVAVGGTGNWFILDSTRSAFNEADDRLDADNLNIESTSNSDIDFLSNGFKIRAASTAGINQSGDTHIYLAFAEAPAKYSNAR